VHNQFNRVHTMAIDGKALLVEGATADGEPVRFALSLTDVQHFVAFLC